MENVNHSPAGGLPPVTQDKGTACFGTLAPLVSVFRSLLPLCVSAPLRFTIHRLFALRLCASAFHHSPFSIHCWSSLRLCASAFKALAALALFAFAASGAVPFNREFTFKQPNGTVITYRGKGDNYYAAFHYKGYSILRDDVRKAYVYAKCAADGSGLVPTTAIVGVDPIPSGVSLDEEAKVTTEARRTAWNKRYAQLHDVEGETARWNALKELNRKRMAARAAGDKQLLDSYKYSDVTGKKVGLTILVDFPDCPATIDSEVIDNMINGEDFHSYGCYSSVRSYYLDVSNTNLDYSNIVIPYVRVPKTKAYYNSLSQNAAIEVFFSDVLAAFQSALNADSDLAASFAEQAEDLTLTKKDGLDCVRCFNVEYAGTADSDWATGLWPCSGSLQNTKALPNVDSVYVSRFQMSNVGTTPEVYVFCHENGHMLCDYPDFYDYEYDSVGGAGLFCLMNGRIAQYDRCPPIASAYCRFICGWTEPTTLNKFQSRVATVRSSEAGWAAQNEIFFFPNPESKKKEGVYTEYYLIENRQQYGRDQYLPASGIAIWHCDELGDRDNQSILYNTKHANYELTLMQADGLWHFQNNENSGDKYDLWYDGNGASNYKNMFTSGTLPSSRWWSGKSSGLMITNFSASGTEMTFCQQGLEPRIANAFELNKGRVGTPYRAQLLAIDCDGALTWSADGLPDGLTLDASTGIIGGVPETAGTFTNTFTVVTEWNLSTNRPLAITILPVVDIPYTADFSSGGFDAELGWFQEDGTGAGAAYDVTNAVDWAFMNGDTTYPSAACSSPYNMGFFFTNELYRCITNTYTETEIETNQVEGVEEVVTNTTEFVSISTNSIQRMLVTPRLNLEGLKHGSVSFRHYMRKRYATDTLSVYYRTAYDAEWQLLEMFTNQVPKTTAAAWATQTITLPDEALTATAYIGFEATYNGGWGVHIDDVVIGNPVRPLVIETDEIEDVELGTEVEYVLEFSGGVEPYTWTVEGDLPDGLSFTNGVLYGTATTAQEATFTVYLTDGDGSETNKTFTLDAHEPYVILFKEDFEHSGGDLPTYWSNEYIEYGLSWTVTSDGKISTSESTPSVAIPASAYEGEYFCKLYWGDYTTSERVDHITRLVSPLIYLGASPIRPTLTFRLAMRPMYNTYGTYDQDTLKVYFKANADDDWGEPLAVYTNAVPTWTKETVVLPTGTSYGYLCFEGNALYGYGVCLDDIRVNEVSFAPVILTEATLPSGHAYTQYSATLEASGGTEPYTWSASGLPSTLTCSTNGVISGIASKGTYTFTATVTDAEGLTSTAEFTVTFVGGLTIDQFVGTFDTGMDWDLWTITGNNYGNWVFQDGGTSRDGETPVPESAYEGGTNACLFTDSNSKVINASLTTPMLDLEGCTNATLTFRLCKKNVGTKYKDTFTVLYKTSYDGEATQLLSISSNVTAWTEYTVELPNPTATYFLIFRGKAQYGYGVNLDEIQLSGDYTNETLTVYQQWKKDYYGDSAYDDAADSDGDGLTTLEEFVFGSNPTSADAEAALLNGYVQDDAFYVTYREGVEAREYGVTFDLLTTTNLTDSTSWTTDGMTFVDEADSNTWYQVIYTYGDGSILNAPQRFYRLKATLPDED